VPWLTEDALAQRLHALGTSPRQGRSTALFTLAADVPAAILAKTPGIHVQADPVAEDLRRGLSRLRRRRQQRNSVATGRNAAIW
jgi:hypothetical protein